MTTIDSVETLRANYREQSERVKRKAIDHLDRHCRTFIAHSPFLVIGTAAAPDGDGNAGGGDVSPRGDGPGFVQIVDDRTLRIPDRKGNNRLDTLANIVDNPEVGIIFFIPGFDETLRVNGTATVTQDPAVLDQLAVDGKPALMAIEVTVREAYLHCNRSIRRARLWDEDSRPDRSILPGGGRMVHEMAGLDGDPDEADRSYNEGTKVLY